MSEAWIVILCVGLATVACKAAGPVLLGGRSLGPRTTSVVALLAPVMLVALVVMQTLGGGGGLVVDARVAGVAAAGVALRGGLPLVPAMVVAAVVTAALRAVT